MVTVLKRKPTGQKDCSPKVSMSAQPSRKGLASAFSKGNRQQRHHSTPGDVHTHTQQGSWQPASKFVDWWREHALEKVITRSLWKNQRLELDATIYFLQFVVENLVSKLQFSLQRVDFQQIALLSSWSCKLKKLSWYRQVKWTTTNY